MADSYSYRRFELAGPSQDCMIQSLISAGLMRSVEVLVLLILVLGQLSKKELAEGFIRPNKLRHGILFVMKLEVKVGVKFRPAGCVFWQWVC